MSIGEEEGKGTELSRKAFKVLQKTGLNFAGNVEGGDVFSDTIDVVVCDGFVGNVLLKSGEALAGYLASLIRDELERSWRSRLGYLLAKPAFDEYRRRTHWSEYGAVPLLGVSAAFAFVKRKDIAEWGSLASFCSGLLAGCLSEARCE